MVNLECPNCGSSKIDEKWVEQSESKEERKDFDKYAQEKLKHPPDGNYFIMNTSDTIYKNFIQFTLICQECGYTKVYDVNGKETP